MRQMACVVVIAALAVATAGCKRSGSDQVAAAPATPAVASPSAQAAGAPVPRLHPCAILSDASVALAVTGAQAGEHDDEDESAGISTCRWTVGKSAVVLQTYDAGPGSLPNELSSASLELVEMRRPDAASAVRQEKFDGVGDVAGAFVEAVDLKRGIRKSGAVLMVQQGNQLAVLRIPQLAEGDRAMALDSMKKLGLEIASRL